MKERIINCLNVLDTRPEEVYKWANKNPEDFINAVAEGLIKIQNEEDREAMTEKVTDFATSFGQGFIDVLETAAKDAIQREKERDEENFFREV